MSNGFTRSEIDSSFILVVDSSTQIVDSLFFLNTSSSATDNRQYIHFVDEQHFGREMKAHSYIIQIGGK